MNKTLEVKSIELTLASLAINIKSKPSTTALVMAELIKASDCGVITHPAIAGNNICKTLSLTPENYRAAIAKLTKLKLIVRDQSCVFLLPSLHPPHTSITIKQKK